MNRQDANPSPRAIFMALLGAAAGVGAGVIALSFFPFTYTPHDGTIGPPAFFNFSVTRKVAFYLTLTPLAFLGGLVFAWLDRGRSRLALCAGALVSVALTAGAVLRMPWTVRHDYAPFKFDPGFWIPVALVALYAVWMTLRGRRPPPPEAADHTAFLRWLSAVAIVGIHLWLMFEAAGPEPWRAPILTALFTLGFAWALRRPKSPAPFAAAEPHWLGALETTTWLLLAIFPLTSIAIRLGLSVNWTWARTFPYEPLAGLIAGQALATTSVRRSSGGASSAFPFALIPFSAALLYPGCGLVLNEYDPYHQGEYIYPAWAMSQGLIPYRDIFFVHGFGFNTLPAWVMGDLIRRAPNLDIFFFELVSAVGIGLMGWLYLKTFGRRWWPAAFVLAYAAASAAATKSSRFTPLYFVAAALTMRASASRPAARFAWSFLAGLAAFLAVAFALDTGAVATAAAVFALAAWNLLPRDPMTAMAARVRSLLADGAVFALGFAPGALAAGLWLHAQGALDDFIEVHLAYAAMKRHYDNLPFAQPGLMYFFAPAMTVIGAAALWRLARRPPDETRDPTVTTLLRPEPLFMFLIFFTVANAGMFLRGLDRSDAGHLVYASTLAWPVLAAVAALWTRDAGWPRAFTASAALAALVLFQPFASVAFKGAELTTIHPLKMFAWYSQASHKPAALRYETLARNDTFFPAMREIEALAEPGERLLDLSNRPALFPWARTLAPSRFYAIFYAPNLKWQREILTDLERNPPRLAVWPEPGASGRGIDGVPLEVREWALTAWALDHTTPLKALPDGSILMTVSAGSGAEAAGRPAKVDPELARSMTQDVDFGPAPAIWAASDPGARAIAWRAEIGLERGKSASFVVDSKARAARSMRITTNAPLYVPVSLKFLNASGEPVFTARIAPGLTASTRFDIPLASLPGWRLGQAIASIQAEFAENPEWQGPMDLFIEFSRDPITPEGALE